MKSYTLFQQYIWLVNTINYYKRLTLEEINQKWLCTEMSEGLPIARSTFNRHRNAIEDMFGIVVDCDRKGGFKYYIYNEEVLEEESIQNWMLSTLSVNSILSESKSIHDRILLEQIPSSRENLKKFIDAMKKGHRVKVLYRRYGPDVTPTSLTIDPYAVKLFNRRWYALVKFRDDDAEMFTLAFDRIMELDVSDEKFVYNNDFDPAGWFKNCYGIVNDSKIPVEKVVIRAFGYEAYYLRDLPIHHSQKEIFSEAEYSDFEMTLSPTGDFLAPLLSRGAAIKVLHPQHIADTIKRLHQEAANLYE